MSAPTVPAARVSEGSRRHAPAPVARATLALARVEAVRLLRHPVVLLAYLAMAVYWVLPFVTGEPWTRFPVLHEKDRDTQGVALLVGLAALIAGNLAVLRARRHGTEESYGVLVLPRWARTAGHVLAGVPLALLAGVAAAAHVGVLAAARGAAGQVDPWEVATVPAVVLLLGALGVLVGRLVPSVAAVPLAIVAVYTAEVFAFDFFQRISTEDSRLSWLGLRAGTDPSTEAMPADLLSRPAGEHVVYLVGLTLVVALVALLHDHAPRVRAVTALALALLVTVPVGASQLRPVPDEIRAARVATTERPSTRHICTTADAATYCAFDTYQAWVPQWRDTVDGVRRLLPPEVAARPIAVRQRVVGTLKVEDGGVGYLDGAYREIWQADDRAAGTPDAVSAGTSWGTDLDAFNLAAAVAYRVVGGSVTGNLAEVCGGRAVVALWLAARSTPAAAAGFAEAVRNSSGSSFDTNTVTYGPSLSFNLGALTAARALLGLPADRVGAELRAQWGAVTGAKTPAAAVAARFDPAGPQRAPATGGC